MPNVRARNLSRGFIKYGTSLGRIAQTTSAVTPETIYKIFIAPWAESGKSIILQTSDVRHSGRPARAPASRKPRKTRLCRKTLQVMKKPLLTLLLLLIMCAAPARASRGDGGKAPVPVSEMQPAFWWAGMANPQLQVLLRGVDLGTCEVEVRGEGVRLERTVRPANSHYLLLYLDTHEAAPQTFHIVLKQPGGASSEVPYTLHARTPKQRTPFDATDAIYLLMPDRFVNGDRTNDVVPGLLDVQCDPAQPDARHGGDIAGITSMLGYLAELGVTAIWPTPLLTNDMPSHSYHGYAITDYYHIDPRFGTNEDYRAMVRKAHAHGIKVVMDMVTNHCGSRNVLFADLPDSTWFNNGSCYVQTAYKTSAVGDPHGSQYDARNAQDGWFVEVMPDWNQRNPDVLTYLTQNAIWWIEYAGIDGIRQDTYPYADRRAMAEWNKAIRAEYPGFNVVGEAWLNNNVGVSYWQSGSPLAAGDDSELPTVMDFPLMGLLNSALDEETNDWDRGLARFYDYFSQDRVYADPLHLLTFLGNHDTDRFARTAGQAARIDRYRRALVLLLTVRGIPQLYYGDELGMWGDKSRGDGAFRTDFPAAKATDYGRNAQEEAYHDLTRRLLTWRRANPALAAGTFKHFAVNGGVYVYARQGGGSTATVLMNGSTKPVELQLERYAEVLPLATATDVLTGRAVCLDVPTLRLDAGETLLLHFPAKD